MNEIGARWGVEVQHIPTEFTGLLPALEAGRCDVIASGIYLTAERLETFDAQPYFNTSVVLVTNADNTEIAAPEDLAGKTVAVQSGTNYINILNALNEELAAAGSEQMNVQQYPKQTDAIQQLIVGRADATITQDTEQAFREIAQPGQFKIAYTYPDPETFGVYHRQNSPELSFRQERLAREVALRQEMYTNLASAWEQARIEEVRDTPLITVVEPAEEPVRPDSRRLVVKTGLALFAGMFLGALLGLLRERLRSPNAASRDEYEEFVTLRREFVGDLRHPWRPIARAFGRGEPRGAPGGD